MSRTQLTKTSCAGGRTLRTVMSLFSPSKSWREFNSTLFYWMLLSLSSLKLVFALGSKEKFVGGSTTCSVFSADKTEEEDPSFWSHKPPVLPLQHAKMGWQGSHVAGPHLSKPESWSLPLGPTGVFSYAEAQKMSWLQVLGGGRGRMWSTKNQHCWGH